VTVAEQIKRSTKPLSHARLMFCEKYYLKRTVLLSLYSNSQSIGAAEYQFIDGSKLTCRVYW
jgi:hypothetical protein